MSRFLDQKLSGLVAYVPGEQPKGMSRLIKLNTNESPFPPPPGVVDAINAAQIRDLRLYSDPTCFDLKAALAAYHGVGVGNVFVSNSSDEALAFCFHGLCQNGAVFPDITYGFYSVFCDMFGVKKQIISLNSDFSIDISHYAKAVGTVFIANPNAPTGLTLSLENIDALAGQNTQRLVVVDEAYIDFGGQTALPLLKKRDNLLVVRTFSKSRQMAGARLGYAIGSEALIADLNTLRSSFNPYSVNRLSLLAGEKSVEDEAYFQSCRSTIIATRQRVAEALTQMGFTLTDSRANFLFAAPPRISGKAYFAALRQRGILVRRFDSERIENYVRITVGSDNEMDELLSVTAEILKEG